MTKLTIDNTKFYRLVPSTSGLYLEEQVNINDTEVLNDIRENYSNKSDEKIHLTSYIRDDFLDAHKYRSDYDKLVLRQYHKFG